MERVKIAANGEDQQKSIYIYIYKKTMVTFFLSRFRGLPAGSINDCGIQELDVFI